MIYVSPRAAEAELMDAAGIGPGWNKAKSRKLLFTADQSESVPPHTIPTGISLLKQAGFQVDELLPWDPVVPGQPYTGCA